MPSFRSLLAGFAAFLLSAPSLFAFQFPLSDSAARSAYFLGQRRDTSTGQFLIRYSRHLPPPKTGPYVSDVTLFTPYAQLVHYSSQQGTYSAQQAELDSRTKFSTIEISVEISLTATYGAYIYEPPASSSSGVGTRLRRGNFWRDFSVRLFDNRDLLPPASQHGQPLFRCFDDACDLVGAVIYLSLPADSFTSESATVEVTTPDGQVVPVDFDLSGLL